MNNDQIEKINEEAANLIADLGVLAEVETSFDEETSLVNVQVDSQDAAVLIGFHGETLHSLQLIITFMAHKILGEWMKVTFNVGDYRQKREEQLKKLALNLAMKVKFSKEPQYIPNLTAGERRIIHLILADHPEVVSESEGEGRQRQLVIKPKTL
ncbi:MAG: KH domain-containing protein [Patescibacteria group bacterium]|nr:KH domain-containing protein [Patescibacteria group bacterium]